MTLTYCLYPENKEVLGRPKGSSLLSQSQQAGSTVAHTVCFWNSVMANKCEVTWPLKMVS